MIYLFEDRKYLEGEYIVKKIVHREIVQNIVGEKVILYPNPKISSVAVNAEKYAQAEVSYSCVLSTN